jgi:hypothetical protein
MRDHRPTVRRLTPWLLALACAAVLSACETGGQQPPPEDEIPNGTLVVAVTGLPAGALANVAVSGPGTFSETIDASETFVGLTPGQYAVNATTVSFEGIEYAANVSGSPATVTDGGTATTTVTFAATSTDPGDLVVTITGLPVGVDADVDVSGPAGFSQSLTASQTFTDVDPGSYTVTAASVSDGDDVYAPTVSSSPATVPAGGSVTVTVTYTFLDPTAFGALQVNVVGLPDGTDGDVTVTGFGFEQQLTQSTTLTFLAPGNYTVTGANVFADGLDHATIITGSPALVLPDATTTVTVLYQPFVPIDGDALSNPGLHALFRATSPNPVFVEGLLFNAANPIDTKGIQLRNELADPANPDDFLAFELIFGQSDTRRINVALECGREREGGGSIVRARLRVAGTLSNVGTVNCNSNSNFTLNSANGRNYVVEVSAGHNDPFYTDYVLSIDAFCFQGCTYQPYEP